MEAQNSEDVNVNMTKEGFIVAIKEVQRITSSSSRVGRGRKKRIKLLDDIVGYISEIVAASAENNEILLQLIERINEVSDLISEVLKALLSFMGPVVKYDDNVLLISSKLATTMEIMCRHLNTWCSEESNASFVDMTSRLLKSILRILSENMNSWVCTDIIGDTVTYLLWKWGHETSNLSGCQDWSKSSMKLMNSIGSKVLTCPDFYCQYSALIVIQQWMSWVDSQCSMMYLKKAFSSLDEDLRSSLLAKSDASIEDPFDDQARLFLNNVNLNVSRRTFISSVRCLYFFAENEEIIAPENQEFWIDFSFKTKRIHFFCSIQGNPWVSLNIRADHITSFCVSWLRKKNGRPETQEGTQTQMSRLTNLTHDSLLFLHIRLNMDLDLISKDLEVLYGTGLRSLFIVFEDIELLEKTLTAIGLPIHNCGDMDCDKPMRLCHRLEGRTEATSDEGSDFDFPPNRVRESQKTPGNYDRIPQTPEANTTYATPNSYFPDSQVSSIFPDNGHRKSPPDRLDMKPFPMGHLTHDDSIFEDPIPRKCRKFIREIPRTPFKNSRLLPSPVPFKTPTTSRPASGFYTSTPAPRRLPGVEEEETPPADPIDSDMEPFSSEDEDSRVRCRSPSPITLPTPEVLRRLPCTQEENHLSGLIDSKIELFPSDDEVVVRAPSPPFITSSPPAALDIEFPSEDEDLRAPSPPPITSSPPAVSDTEFPSEDEDLRAAFPPPITSEDEDLRAPSPPPITSSPPSVSDTEFPSEDEDVRASSPPPITSEDEDVRASSPPPITSSHPAAPVPSAKGDKNHRIGITDSNIDLFSSEDEDLRAPSPPPITSSPPAASDIESPSEDEVFVGAPSPPPITSEDEDLRAPSPPPITSSPPAAPVPSAKGDKNHRIGITTDSDIDLFSSEDEDLKAPSPPPITSSKKTRKGFDGGRPKKKMATKNKAATTAATGKLKERTKVSKVTLPPSPPQNKTSKQTNVTNPLFVIEDEDNNRDERPKKKKTTSKKSVQMEQTKLSVTITHRIPRVVVPKENGRTPCYRSFQEPLPEEQDAEAIGTQFVDPYLLRPIDFVNDSLKTYPAAKSRKRKRGVRGPNKPSTTILYDLSDDSVDLIEEKLRHIPAPPPRPVKKAKPKKNSKPLQGEVSKKRRGRPPKSKTTVAAAAFENKDDRTIAPKRKTRMPKKSTKSYKSAENDENYPNPFFDSNMELFPSEDEDLRVPSPLPFTSSSPQEVVKKKHRHIPTSPPREVVKMHKLIPTSPPQEIVKKRRGRPPKAKTTYATSAASSPQEVAKKKHKHIPTSPPREVVKKRRGRPPKQKTSAAFDWNQDDGTVTPESPERQSRTPKKSVRSYKSESNLHDMTIDWDNFDPEMGLDDCPTKKKIKLSSLPASPANEEQRPSSTSVVRKYDAKHSPRPKTKNVDRNAQKSAKKSPVKKVMKKSISISSSKGTVQKNQDTRQMQEVTDAKKSLKYELDETFNWDDFDPEDGL